MSRNARRSRNRAARPVTMAMLALTAPALALPAASRARRHQPRFLSVSLFARVPHPGQPEGIAIAPGGRVFVGSDTGPLIVRPDGSPPSKLFAFSPHGKLRDQWTIQGQNHLSFYGLFGLALDHKGRVYAVDHSPPRILRIDPRTGDDRVYAEFRDVPPCALTPGGHDCSQTTADMGSFPNFAVFGPNGEMYVTDASQALIWRVPPGGGRSRIWLSDPGFDSLFDPNGAQISPGHKRLFVILSSSSTQRSAGIYTIRIGSDGKPGRIRQFWKARDGDFPDGLAFARSGRVYVTAAGNNQLVVLSHDGREIARTQGSGSSPVPFDEPANPAFRGRHVLVTNHAWTVFNPDHWAVLDVYAGELGVPPIRP